MQDVDEVCITSMSEVIYNPHQANSKILEVEFLPQLGLNVDTEI